jgi:hypothetical protein
LKSIAKGDSQGNKIMKVRRKEEWSTKNMTHGKSKNVNE